MHHDAVVVSRCFQRRIVVLGARCAKLRRNLPAAPLAAVSAPQAQLHHRHNGRRARVRTSRQQDSKSNC